MGLEASNSIAGLDKNWPLSGDKTSRGDDHLRLLKSVLKAQFPGAAGEGFSIPIIASEAELNHLGGTRSNLQAQLDALEVSVSDVSDSSADIGTRVDAVEVVSASNTSSISELEGKVSATEADVLAIQSSLDGGLVDSRISSVEASSANNDSRISSLESRMLTAENQLYAPVGTVLPFYQSSPPVGWSNLGLNDYMMVSRSSAGGTSGGSASPRSHSTSHSHTTGSHRLTVAQIPPHTHPTTAWRDNSAHILEDGDGHNHGFVNQTLNSGSAGGNATHNHGNTSVAGSTWTPKYLNMLVCRKT